VDADPVVAQLLGYVLPECQSLYQTLARRSDDDGPEDELDFRERIIRQVVSGHDGLTKDQVLALQDAIIRANPWQSM
jgi:hypothetical protein